MAIANSTQPVVDTLLPCHIKESSLTPANAPTASLFSFEDRTIIVTGAGRGLGITLATAVLEAGSNVVCLEILPEPSKEEWEIISRLQMGSKAKVSATYHQCNVVDENVVASTLAQAAEFARN